MNIIVDQYLRVADKPTAIVTCTKIFTTTIGLPCAYCIQNCFYNQAGGRVLKLEDIHSYWRFVKSLRHATRQAKKQENNYTNDDNNDRAIDVDSTSSPIILEGDILRVQEPAIVKVKGRPAGGLNRVWARASQRLTAAQRRQRAFHESTQREPSDFEYAQTQIPDS